MHCDENVEAGSTVAVLHSTDKNNFPKPEKLACYGGGDKSKDRRQRQRIGPMRRSI